MAKYFFLILVMTVVSVGSFGQTINQRLEHAKNDPKRMENAAKADAQLINKKNVTDSSVAKPVIIKSKEQGRKSKERRIPAILHKKEAV
ncbi:MAG TPA: hypothetical protein VI461_12780 [Chitinophagaceae bacterium]|nr:hypothetical protein [Chitinophagaceae bacterium]